MNLISWYVNRLESHPYLSKSISSVFIFSLGDILCQKIENRINNTKTNRLDINRLIKQSSYGVFAGTYLHIQFCVIIPYLFPISTNYRSLKSVAYALTISDSIYNFGFYFYCDLLTGQSFKMKTTFCDKFIPTQILNLQVWPILQYINFSMIPIKFRVLYDNILSIFWNAYLSWIQNKNDKTN